MTDTGAVRWGVVSTARINEKVLAVLLLQSPKFAGIAGTAARLRRSKA